MAGFFTARRVMGLKVPAIAVCLLVGPALTGTALSAPPMSAEIRLAPNPRTDSLDALRDLSNADTVVLDRSGRVANLGFARMRPQGASTNSVVRLSPNFALETTQMRLGDGPEISIMSPPRLTATPNGTGFYVGARWELSENVRLRVGNAIALEQPAGAPEAALPRQLSGNVAPTRTVDTQIAGIEFAPTQWSSIAFSATRSREQNSLFSAALSGPIGTASVAETTMLGISARAGFGDGWVTTVAYGEGISQLDLNRSGLAGNLNPVRSSGYGISVSKEGLLGDDALGITVSRPLHVYSGTLTGMSTSALNPGLSQGIAPAKSDVQLGYVTTFLDGAVALQANAAYQINAGDKGENAVTGVARAKINF